MNFYSIIAFSLAGTVFLVSVLTSGDNPMAMVDYHGALIVMGGTIAATAISFQIDRLFVMIKIFIMRTLMGKKPNYIKTIEELMALAEAYRSSAPELSNLIEKSRDPFVKEAMNLLLDEVVTKQKLQRILRTRVDRMFDRYAADAARFKSMGKYPPAMGLMGAVLGMIALLGTLGQPGAEDGVGPAMSVALVATFYGIALANLVVIPIGENLAEGAKEIRTKNIIIVEGIRLISERTNPIVLAEELNSFLLPNERIDWRKVV